jgi:RNA polymerase sigma-70 factor (ECF subfamily)
LGKEKAENFLEHLGPLQGPLEAYCRRSLRDRNEVQDVLQSAIASAFRDFDLYAQGTNFRAWIFRYVHLEILHHNRRAMRGRHEELVGDVAADEGWILASEEALSRALLEDPDLVLEQCDAEVAEAVRNLSALERGVLLLQTIGDFKYREIAEILDIPIGTVMSTLSRCRGRLRSRLVRYGQEHGLLRPSTGGPGPGPVDQ